MVVAAPSVGLTAQRRALNCLPGPSTTGSWIHETGVAADRVHMPVSNRMRVCEMGGGGFGRMAWRNVRCVVCMQAQIIGIAVMLPNKRTPLLLAHPSPSPTRIELECV